MDIPIYDFEHNRGDDRPYTLRIFKADGRTPQSVAGATIWFVAKRNLSDADASAQIKKSNGVFGGLTVTDIPGGVATFEILNAELSALPNEIVTLQYDVQVKDSSAKIRTVLRGTIKVPPDVTLSTA